LPVYFLTKFIKTYTKVYNVKIYKVEKNPKLSHKYLRTILLIF
jgi:hypothetical protein